MNTKPCSLLLFIFVLLPTVISYGNNISPAVDKLEKKITQNPNDIKSRLQLAAAYSQCNMLSEEKEQYKEVLKLDETNLTANINLGSIYIDEDEYKLAIKHYEKAVEGGEREVWVYNALSSLYRDIRLSGEVRKEYIEKEFYYSEKAKDISSPQTDYKAYVTALRNYLIVLSENMKIKEEYKHKIIETVDEGYQVISKEKDPYMYYYLQYILGEAHRLSSNKEELEVAREYYKRALAYFDSDNFPDENFLVTSQLEYIEFQLHNMGLAR